MRVRMKELNLITLDVADLTNPVHSDKLFQGMFATKMLVDRLMLEIKITEDGVGDDVTEASLGWLTFMSTAGIEFTIPLRFLFYALPELGVPCHVRTITNGLVYTIPIPFGLFQGFRAKDTYLVSEKCKDYYIEINGAIESGVNYVSYTVKPYVIGERSRKISIPSHGKLHYTTDDIPANTWHESKLEIIGATWVVLAQSDYADFDENDHLKLTVDGESCYQIMDVRRINRAYASVRHSRDDTHGNDVIPDKLIVLLVSLDRKMGKISRSSKYTIDFMSDGTMTLLGLWQEVKGQTVEESLDLAKRQGIDKLISVTDPMLKIMPVDVTGRLNLRVKPIYRKVFKEVAPKQYERLANAI